MINLDEFTPYADSGKPTFERLVISGVDSLKVETNESKGRWFTGRNIPIEPGSTYKATANVLTDYLNESIYTNPKLTAVTLAVSQWSSGLNWTQTDEISIRNPDWKIETIEFTASPSAAFARIELRNWVYNAAAWANSFEFAEVIPPSPVYLGSAWQYPNKIEILLNEKQ